MSLEMNDDCEHRWTPQGNGISICELCQRTVFSSERPKNTFHWTLIHDGRIWETWRAKVYGGWLVRDGKIGGSFSELTFVPDDHHRWEIDNDQDI